MRLLDVNDLAVLMGLSVSHVRQNIVTHRAFPRPILLPSTGNRPKKRWDNDEVEEFLRKLKAPEPKAKQKPKPPLPTLTPNFLRLD